MTLTTSSARYTRQHRTREQQIDHPQETGRGSYRLDPYPMPQYLVQRGIRRARRSSSA